MPTRQEVYTAILNADKAGDSAAVRALGAYLKTMPAEEAPPDPTEGMSTTDKLLAGTGKAFADAGRGVGQLMRKVMPDKYADKLGLPTQADIDEAKKLDAPLMKTTAGKVGNIGGNVAIALPTVFIPGANTVTGSGAIGAGMGFIQPVASDESRLKNTVVGGALGAAAPVVARTVAAGVRGAKALFEPFTPGGREAIAGRTLQRFGVDAADVAGATSNPTVTGARQTLAEQITRPEGAAGAARLQDSLGVVDPKFGRKMLAREVENNAARVKTLRDLAGEGGAKTAAEAARQATAKEAYGKAFNSDSNVFYHGGSYEGGGPIKQVLYLTKDPDIAASYVQGGKDLGRDVNELRKLTFSGTNAAPEQEVNQLAKILGIDNGFNAPASVFDAGLHGKDKVDALVSALKLKGYDHAVLPDVAYDLGKEGASTIVFRGGNVGKAGLTPAMESQVAALMKMPAIKAAIKDAQELALNQGKTLDTSGSTEGLHNMKLVLDDQIANLSNGTVSQVNKAKSIQAARDKLVAFIESVSPEYKTAREGYAAMSKPINQMDIADTLFRKGTSATSDLGGTPRLMPDKYVNLLKNEEATVKAATGRDLGKLSQVLDPDQFQKVMAVGQELDKAAAVGRAANGPGSATAQRLATQNILHQMFPDKWASNTVLNTVMRPVQFGYNEIAEPKIQAVLADLIMNPAKAQAALQAAKTAPQRLSPEVQAALPYLSQILKTSVPATAISSQR